MNKRVRIVLISKIMPLLLLLISSAAQSLTDEELFEQGRQAYQEGKFIEASMKLYAYKLRDPINMQNDAVHRKQVNEVLAFCQDQPAQKQQQLNRELKQCRDDIQDLAEKCDTQYVASTSSYMLNLPKLDKLSTEEKRLKAWPLVCRGGGNLRLTWPNYKSKGVENALMLSFVKGNRGVGNNKRVLNPGQCSWKDRGMHPSEPNTICYGLGKQRFNVSWLLSDQRQKFRPYNLPKELGKLSNENQFAEFQVSNNNTGCLVVAPKFKVFMMQPAAPMPKNLNIRQ